MPVSVILPTYNRPEMLDRALTCIAAQTYTNVEALVVNDGGCDVAGVVRRYPFAQLITHERNRGLAAARNTAIGAARGVYVAYLDDDDVWFPEHLEILRVALQGSACRAAYTDCYYWYDERRMVRELSLDFDRHRFRRQNLTPIICVMHTRDLFGECGLFDESLRTHEDYDLWRRMIEYTDMLHIPLVTALYSKRSGDRQLSDNPQRMAAEFEAVRRRYG